MEDKKTNPIFELINAIFASKEYVYEITAETARQSLFMVLRRLAIKYPVEMNVFNYSNVNALDTIRFLSDYLFCGSVPKWVRTSVKSSKKKSKDDITKQDINLYKRVYDVTDSQFEDAMKFFPDELIAEVKDNRDFYKKLNNLKYEKEIDNG